jgi:hypothetical protein
MKYANAAAWIFYGWLLRKLHMPSRWVHEVEDQASMRMFDCSLDFEPVALTAAPVGWRCPHFSVTAGGGMVLSPPTASVCGCALEPVFA